MAVIIQKFIKANNYTLPIVNEVGIFTDESKISSYAKASVNEMQRLGLIEGKDNNLFDPQAVATRAEAAVILRRLMNFK